MHQRFNMQADALRERVQIVATFEERQQSSAGVLVGFFHQSQSHPFVHLCTQADLRERIGEMGIEAGGDKNDIGTEVVNLRQDSARECLAIVGVGGAGIHWAIQRCADARADTGL